MQLQGQIATEFRKGDGCGKGEGVEGCTRLLHEVLIFQGVVSLRRKPIQEWGGGGLFTVAHKTNVSALQQNNLYN